MGLFVIKTETNNNGSPDYIVYRIQNIGTRKSDVLNAERLTTINPQPSEPFIRVVNIK